MNGRNARRTVAAAILTAFVLSGFSGCSAGGRTQNKDLDTSKPVTLTIAGQYDDFKAIDSTIQEFNKLYPSCTIEYEFLQDYRNTLQTSLENESNPIDLFLTDNIQSDSPFLPYTLDLYSVSDKLDLSETYDGLTNNYQFLGSETKQLYSVPLGGEVRGLFVNKTLLEKYNIAVPTNKTELLEACNVLSENGYIPFQGNPGSFAQQLMFPYVTNIIAEADEKDKVHNLIDSCDEAAAELFREPMEFIYNLTANNYYNYKYIETEYNIFTDTDVEKCMKWFLDIAEDENGNVTVGDEGKVAFFPGVISMKNYFDKGIEDYHSNIEYEFILSPVSDNGGYAYMSPSRGISVNKNSSNVDWAIEFVDFIFDEDNNKTFAAELNIIPNTKDAVQYVSKQFGIPENQITQPDDIAFGYIFYNLITKQLVNTSKSNNPKYMNDDGNGNVTMYDFEYYMDGLRAAFTEQRQSGESS